jgi:hypothetical protein
VTGAGGLHLYVNHQEGTAEDIIYHENHMNGALNKINALAN